VLATTAVIALPGVGLVTAGPLAAALAGAGAGALTGGLVGALVGLGIPEDRARLYDEGLQHGGIVMALPRGRTTTPGSLSASGETGEASTSIANAYTYTAGGD